MVSWSPPHAASATSRSDSFRSRWVACARYRRSWEPETRMGSPDAIAAVRAAVLLDAQVEHLSSDHEPLDLARPLPDLGQFRVAQVSLDLVLLDVSIATVDLNGVVRRALRHLRRVQLCLSCGQ